MISDDVTPRPWYKEPWPWVIIAIPFAAVLMGAITFYLAVSHPDYLVVEEEQYREIKSELRAQSVSEESPASTNDSEAGSEDGEH
jgi:hypothetical protein